MLAIYATSIDYDPNEATSKAFFATVQNKMHWASHGHTAAEIIYSRADSSKTNMGLTSWTGNKIRKTDVEIAKNYLNTDELNILNRLVSMYLDFAELQALNRQPMYMKDWITKIDDFLKMTSRDILSHAGKISHETALEKASVEYVKYQSHLASKELSLVEQHFLTTVKELEKTSLN